jgi:hypothetical protein
MTYTYTTKKQVRGAFWHAFEGAEGISRRKIKNDSGNWTMYNTDTIFAFVAFVDMLARDGYISEYLADRVTL